MLKILLQDYFNQSDLCNLTWNFNQEFFIQTENKGNFVFSAACYDGTNEVKKYKGSYQDWIGIGNYGRNKGDDVSVFKIESYAEEKPIYVIY